MTKQEEISAELTKYTWGDKLSPEARQWLLDDIAEQQSVEPETERRDLPPKNISDGELFLLWLRS